MSAPNQIGAFKSNDAVEVTVIRSVVADELAVDVEMQFVVLNYYCRKICRKFEHSKIFGMIWIGFYLLKVV